MLILGKHRLIAHNQWQRAGSADKTFRQFLQFVNPAQFTTHVSDANFTIWRDIYSFLGSILLPLFFLVATEFRNIAHTSKFVFYPVTLNNQCKFIYVKFPDTYL